MSVSLMQHTLSQMTVALNLVVLAEQAAISDAPQPTARCPLFLVRVNGFFGGGKAFLPILRAVLANKNALSLSKQPLLPGRQ